MASHRDRQAVFADIFENTLEQDIWGDEEKDFLKGRLQHFAKSLDFMKGATVHDYYDWSKRDFIEKHQQRQNELHEINQTTLESFWNICLSHVHDSPEQQGKQLHDLQGTYALPPFPMGKLYGRKHVWLLARSYLLRWSASKTPSGFFNSPFDPSTRTCSGAVIYPDGHPCQYREKASQSTSAHQSVTEQKDDLDPNKLRRWCAIGGLAYKYGDEFRLTGYVLVMDMDKDRNHHPWLILASEWPDLNNDGDDESGEFTARENAKISDFNVHGILPGDIRRTPIAKIIHMKNASKAQRAKPMLENFGPDFEFSLLRKDGGRSVSDTEKWKTHHPDLVFVTQWFWDPVSNSTTLDRPITNDYLENC